MSNRLFTKKKLLGLSLAMVIAGSAAVATAGPHYKEHGMNHKMERMLKRLDLSEEQEVQVEEILAPMKELRKERKGFPKMRAMMSLDPDAADYTKQAEEQATSAAEKVKARILNMASVRQQVHAVLNEEQKAELKAMVSKKLKRMEERCEDDD